MVDELMKGITDDIDNHPLDFLVAMRAPAKSSICHANSGDSLEFVVRVQLSPLFPLARERCRMLTPIIHPLVTPLPDPTDASNSERSTEKASAERGVETDGPAVRPPSIHEAGRMVLVKGTTMLGGRSRTLGELLTAFRDEWILDPVAFAQHWARPDPLRSPPFLRQVGHGRWRPELHPVCPRAFRAEVRLLMLVRHRGDYTAGTLPMEVVWLIIDALLRLHIASGSLFFQ